MIEWNGNSTFPPSHHSQEHRPFFADVVARLRELRDIQVEAKGKRDHGHRYGMIITVYVMFRNCLYKLDQSG